jgi:hypothetical protein
MSTGRAMPHRNPSGGASHPKEINNVLPQTFHDNLPLEINTKHNYNNYN